MLTLFPYTTLFRSLDDIFLALHNIEVFDPASRSARQDVLVTLTRLRRDLDTLGLRHSVVGGPTEAEWIINAADDEEGVRCA